MNSARHSAGTLPPAAVLAAEREVAPQVLVLAQHVAHGVGAIEAGVRPQDARVRVLAEDALDRVDVRVRVQHELVLLGERDHAPRHRQVGVGAVQVELADRRVAAAAQALLEERRDGVVAHPGADVAARAVRAAATE